MGRKPERFKKELSKDGPELKEILYAPNEGEQDDGLSPTGESRVDLGDKAAYTAWRGRFTPESQKETGTTDEDLNLHHKEVQAILDQEGEGFKMPFFSDWSIPVNEALDISVFVDEPGHLQIIYGRHDFLDPSSIRLRGITWKTLKPPRIATDLKKVIKEYNRGGTDKQRAAVLTRLHKIFKEMDKHI